MALNPVTLMELLRPWRGAGITHLLAMAEPGDPTPEELASVHQEPALGAGPTATPVAGAAAPQGNAPAQHNNGAIASTPPAGAPVPPPVQSHTEPRSVPSHLLPPQPGNRGGMGTIQPKQPGQPVCAVPPVQELAAANTELRTWPASWQQLWQRTRPASIVWSYPALAQDLAGQGSPERSQLMRGLIGSLALPKGSSAFWPLTAYQDSGTCHMPSAFAGAITRLAPQVVVLLGASALPLSGFALTLSFPFTQQILGGRLFVLLPETETLIDDAAAKARATAFLRAQFASIPSLFFTKG